jgi:predicted Zn-dependent protease
MLLRDEALRICESLLAHAKAAGAGDASVSLRNSVEAHARFADNRVTTSGRSEDVDITATVWIAGRRGSASANDPGEAALKQTAGEAVAIARVSPVHREYVPTVGPLDYPDARGSAEAIVDVDLDARASGLERVLAACRAAKVTGAGFHTATAAAAAVATANGNRRFFRTSGADFSVTARSEDGTGSGYFSGNHFDLGRLNIQAIGEQAIAKAVRSRQPRPIEPGAYPVILEPQAVADLVGFLTDAFDARTAEEGRSPFSATEGRTRIGEALFDRRLNLYSDPMHRDLPVVPATGEGIPAVRLSLIKAGVLENLQSTRFWARERKREPSPGPVNYIMESTEPPVTTDAMIKSLKRGLLISRFWYVRLVDPRTIVLTGLTRDGLWWIEDGQVRYPVRNLRFNQSVLAMLSPGTVEAIGATQRQSSQLMVPALRLASFAFTSVSDAI